MGIMDRDYYREKTKGEKDPDLKEWLKKPMVIVALIVLIAFLIAIMI